MTARTKLLGVDFGTVRIGLAVTDPDRKFAFPLTIYERRTRDEDAAYFRTLVEYEEIGAIVVGLPIHTDGREGRLAAAARAYGKWLGETTGLPVAFFDERFTTQYAESSLWDAGLTHRQRKERRDAVAAQVLLQIYLEAGCPDGEGWERLDG